ncbi:MAG: PIN domain-containing protein [Anaerolinea sp.]|nr:PIN domain-containing protein [Anaerolinea sp.]
MPTETPRVFIDADVLFAGSASASAHGASLVVLRMSEITLVQAITSVQVITEVERNLAQKLPRALPAFHLLVNRSLTVVADPTIPALQEYTGLADAKDLPILVTAVREQCPWLITFNTRHFRPGHVSVTVLPPGAYIQRVRHLLTQR